MRVALVLSDSAHSRALYHYLRQKVEVVGVAVDNPVSAKKLLERRMRRLGRKVALSQLAFRVAIQAPLSKLGASRRSQLLQQAQLCVEPIDHPATVRGHSVNSEAVRQALGTWEPELIVLHGTRIVGQKTLRCVAAPWLNLHAGITPRYRGVHGGWWALAEQAVEDFGATVHVVDEGVDTGAVLAQERITPEPGDHFGTYPTLQFVAALKALNKVLDAGLPLNPLPRHDVENSKLRFHPTVGEYVRAWWLHGVR